MGNGWVKLEKKMGNKEDIVEGSISRLYRVVVPGFGDPLSKCL